MMAPEWSHILVSDTIESSGVTLSLTATEQERHDLARRLKLLSLNDFSAKVTVRRQGQGNLIFVEGLLQAQVEQSCVVTGAPVREDIEESFEAWFSEQDHVVSLARARRERAGISIDSELPILDEKDDPEPVIEGQIDIGELLTQQLSLALNPYPRTPGVSVVDIKGLTMPQTRFHEEEEAGPPGRVNPFAALKDWKFKSEKEK